MRATSARFARRSTERSRSRRSRAHSLPLGISPSRPRSIVARTTSTRAASRRSPAASTTRTAALPAANVVVLTSFGFDYVPGDFAARLAADGLEPLSEVLVAYSVSNVAASSGTRKTIGHVMRQPQVTWEGGRLVESRFGASMRTMRFPFGDRAVVEWSGTEPLTVPRHTQTQRVRSYVRAPRAAARTARIARLAAPLVGLTGRVGDGPSPQRRARTKFTVVAEAHGPNGSRRVTLTGQDPYGLDCAPHRPRRACSAKRGGAQRRHACPSGGVRTAIVHRQGGAADRNPGRRRVVEGSSDSAPNVQECGDYGH